MTKDRFFLSCVADSVESEREGKGIRRRFVPG